MTNGSDISDTDGSLFSCFMFYEQMNQTVTAQRDEAGSHCWNLDHHIENMKSLPARCLQASADLCFLIVTREQFQFLAFYR